MYCTWCPCTQILGFDFFREEQWQNKTKIELLLPFRPLKVALWHTMVAFLFHKHTFCLRFHLGITKFQNKRNEVVRQFYYILHQLYLYHTDRNFVWVFENWGLWTWDFITWSLWNWGLITWGLLTLGPLHSMAIKSLFTITLSENPKGRQKNCHFMKCGFS